MKIVLKKTSLVDFPGKVAAVFFFPGCNLRCPWCQNRELVTGSVVGLLPPDTVYLEEALAHLDKRRHVLGGVVLSGGEPTIYPELPSLIKEIKKTRLPVKLDTNGVNPDMLSRLLSLEETRPDYIALDLKLAPDRYKELAPEAGSSGGHSSANPGKNLTQSAAMISSSGIAHEYRSLALPSGFSEADIEALAPIVDSCPWYFRPFRPGNCLDPAWDNFHEPSLAAVMKLAEKAKTLGKNALVPG